LKTSTLLSTILLALALTLSNSLFRTIGIDESTADAVKIFYFGHQGPSFKDGFYDLLNVDASLKVMLDLVLGIQNPLQIHSSLLIKIVLSVLYVILVYLSAKVLWGRWHLTPLAVILAFTSPAFALSRNPPSISAVLSLTTIYILIVLITQKQNIDTGPFVSLIITFFMGLLTHGTALVTLVLVASFIIVSKVLPLLVTLSGSINSYKRITYIAIIILIIYIVLSSIRFVYSSLYRSAFMTYFQEFLKYYAGFGTYHRELKMFNIPAVPRLTALSWALPPVLAYTPLIFTMYDILRSRKTSINTMYLVFSSTSAIFLISGYLTTFFSNSLARELYFPAYMLLYILITYTLPGLTRHKASTLIVLILVAFASIAGLCTPIRSPSIPQYLDIARSIRSSSLQHYVYAQSLLKFLIPSNEEIAIIADTPLQLHTVSLLIYKDAQFIQNLRCKIMYRLIEEPLGIVLMFNSDNYVVMLSD